MLAALLATAPSPNKSPLEASSSYREIVMGKTKECQENATRRNVNKTQEEKDQQMKLPDDKVHEWES